MFQDPFSFKGRIRRTEYGISFLLFIFIMISLVILLGPPVKGGDNSLRSTILLSVEVPLFWFLIAQGTKRCHDLGNSGWWQLIPFYGLVLFFVEGENKKNSHGVNPKFISLQNENSINR